MRNGLNGMHIVSWKMACLERNIEWVWRLKNLKPFMP